MDKISRKLLRLSEEPETSNEATSLASMTTEEMRKRFVEEEKNPAETEKQDDEEGNTEGAKVVSKKGISLTRSLVLFGYESWNELEPGRFIFADVPNNNDTILFKLNQIKLLSN